MPTKTLVTGGGGFIGDYLVSALKDKGDQVRAVDIKRPQWTESRADEFIELDLRDYEAARWATYGVDQVFALAADMGGMGFISSHDAQILHGNALINLNTLEAARNNGVSRYLFTSSACVYPEFLQDDLDSARMLVEDDAFPAWPQDGYGWEKLYSELVALAYGEEFSISTKVVRFHNCYGPRGVWEGGREKFPAAICRKVAVAKITDHHEVDIWGDGLQVRSFMFIDDCIRGILALMDSDWRQPLQLGTSESITVDDMAHMVADIAGIAITLNHIEGPQGVRHRNADCMLANGVLGWVPEISLREGLEATYSWVEKQVKLRG